MQYDIIRDAVIRVDELTRELAIGIGERIAAMGDQPMTLSDARRAQTIVRTLMRPIYGPSRARATSGEMFKRIVTSTDLAVHDAIRTDVLLIDDILREYSPARRQALRSAMTVADDPLARVMVSLGGPQAQAQRVARSFFLDPNRAWVEGQQYRLSDRVWSIRTKQRVRIERALRDGVRRGQGPATIARRLERYLNPDYAPLRYDPDGRIIRRATVGTREGQGANAARTLARTEVQHMHHEATRAFMAEVGIGGIRWALSNAHPRIDICDDLARRSSKGLPPGVYVPDEFPVVPHPRCLCAAVPWLPEAREVVATLLDRYAVAS